MSPHVSGAIKTSPGPVNVNCDICVAKLLANATTTCAKSNETTHIATQEELLDAELHAALDFDGGVHSQHAAWLRFYLGTRLQMQIEHGIAVAVIDSELHALELVRRGDVRRARGGLRRWCTMRGWWSWRRGEGKLVVLFGVARGRWLTGEPGTRSLPAARVIKLCRLAVIAWLRTRKLVGHFVKGVEDGKV